MDILIYGYYFVYQSTDVEVASNLLAIMKNVAMYVCNPLGVYLLWNCWSFGNSIFDLLRNGGNVFQSGSTISQSLQQGPRVQFLLILINPYYSVFFYCAPSLCSVRFLVCISLMAHAAERLFMCGWPLVSLL